MKLSDVAPAIFRRILVLFALAFAITTLALGQDAPTQSIHIQHKGVPALQDGADWPVKSVTVRRSYANSPGKWKWTCCEYARVEVWITNTDIDVCSLPETHDVASLPFPRPDDFALVWSGIELVRKKDERYTDTKLAQANFVDKWPEADGGPIVFDWGHSFDELKKLFPDRSLTVLQRFGFKMEGGAPRLTIVQAPFWGWALYNQAAKDGRERLGGSYGNGSTVLLQWTGGGTLFKIGTSDQEMRHQKAWMRGDLKVTKVCPAYPEDKTMYDPPHWPK